MTEGKWNVTAQKFLVNCVQSEGKLPPPIHGCFPGDISCSSNFQQYRLSSRSCSALSEFIDLTAASHGRGRDSFCVYVWFLFDSVLFSFYFFISLLFSAHILGSNCHGCLVSALLCSFLDSNCAIFCFFFIFFNFLHESVCARLSVC